MKLRIAAAMLLACGLPAGNSLFGQIPNKPIPGAADYYAILDLDARFCYGLDSGADEGRLFASTFASDGALIDADGRETRGSADLAALARAGSHKGVVNPTHYLVNIREELVPGGARQWSYLLVTGAAQPGASDAVIDGGQYWDDLVKTSKGWLIRKRTLLRTATPRPDAASIFTSNSQDQTPPAAPGKSSGNAGLTPADRAEIFQLYAHYPYALDKILDNGQMFANLFTTDGVMVDADGTTISGRDKLAEFVWKRGLTDIKTYITNVMLDWTPAGVNATAYVMNASIPQMPAPSTISPVGMFFDQLIKTPEGWRFKRKTLVPPQSAIPSPAVTAGGARPKATPETQAKEKQSWMLSADDYAQIQQLYARYGQGYDSKVDDGAVYLSVFSKTARFTDQYNKIVDGFDNLDKTYAHSATGKPNPIGLTHSTWNLMVEPAPWGAVGRSYTGGGRVNTPGASPSPGLLGEYIDMIVKTPLGWRFERRIFRQDFPRPVGRVGGAPPAVTAPPSIPKKRP